MAANMERILMTLRFILVLEPIVAVAANVLFLRLMSSGEVS